MHIVFLQKIDILSRKLHIKAMAEVQNINTSSIVVESIMHDLCFEYRGRGCCGQKLWP